VKDQSNNRPKRRRCRFITAGFAVLIGLVALFYGEENWRGKRAWEKCKHDLAAQGELTDWNALIPPPVPDDQNVFKAPKMAEWFVCSTPGHQPTELSDRLSNQNTLVVITNREVAAAYLACSDQQGADFEIIRAGLKRPAVRIDCDYHDTAHLSLPGFLNLRAVARVLVQRARCHLLLGQPAEALHDLTFLLESRRLLEGHPITTVAAMINEAITGLYLDVVTEGLINGTWTESERTVLESQLAQIHLLPPLAESIRTERLIGGKIWETLITKRVAYMEWLEPGVSRAGWKSFFTPEDLFIRLAPAGWFYLNLPPYEAFLQQDLTIFDGQCQVVTPHNADAVDRDVRRAIGNSWCPDLLLSALAVPGYSHACRRVARNQTKADQARIVLALDRYRTAHGEYPDTLDALAPQFMAVVPRDVIGGQPLKYRRTPDGKFLLYSIGGDEQDDGGQTVLNKDGNEDLLKGDWVWGAVASATK
jgi:hypothetical protein